MTEAIMSFRARIIKTLTEQAAYDGTPLQKPGTCSYSGPSTCIVGSLMHPTERRSRGLVGCGDGWVPVGGRAADAFCRRLNVQGLQEVPDVQRRRFLDLLSELQRKFDQGRLSPEEANRIMDEAGVL